MQELIESQDDVNPDEIQRKANEKFEPLEAAAIIELRGLMK